MNVDLANVARALDHRRARCEERTPVATEGEPRRRARGATIPAKRADKPPAGDLICVLVRLHTDGADRFYVLRWPELQRVLINGYRGYLKRHGGRRPRRADSFHTALREPDIKSFLDNWSLFDAFTEVSKTDPGALGVEPQQVVPGQPDSADGRPGLETGVWPVPIVAVYPGRQMRGALGGGVVDVGIGPLAQGGLDEAFGLAVGAGRKGARVSMAAARRGRPRART